MLANTRTLYGDFPIGVAPAIPHRLNTPTGPQTLVVVFYGPLGTISAQKFHCLSEAHALDVRRELDKLDANTDFTILEGHL